MFWYSVNISCTALGSMNLSKSAIFKIWNSTHSNNVLSLINSSLISGRSVSPLKSALKGMIHKRLYQPAVLFLALGKSFPEKIHKSLKRASIGCLPFLLTCTGSPLTILMRSDTSSRYLFDMSSPILHTLPSSAPK